MKLDVSTFDVIAKAAVNVHLLADVEAALVLSMVDGTTPFTDAVELANSIHVHVKIDDVGRLPEEIAAWGPASIRRYDGYVKYSFDGGINLVFSTVPIAEDDLLPGAGCRRRPFVDHIGIDLRELVPAVEGAYREVPAVASANGWRTVHQAGPVHGCHAEVRDKTWAYPPSADQETLRPVEFPLGPLRLHSTNVGCVLRPIDPAHALAGRVASMEVPDCSCR